MDHIEKTSILPFNHRFEKIDQKKALNYEAICTFVATGFFLDDDTYWKNKVCLLPAHNHTLDVNGNLIKSEPWFKWYYSPRSISFEQSLEEYIELFTTITREQLKDSPVILPLSGGLDSRSLALVLKDISNPVQAISYSFKNGYPEHKIAQQIADACGFNFKAFSIESGYLWEVIDELASINQCYSEFTHPRQMAVLGDLKQMAGVLYLGHWGDVLFDRGMPEDVKEDEVISFLFKKMVNPGGFELAKSLWQFWGLKGDYKDYLVSRIETSLSNIKIDNLSAKVRAFKTTQWAHRWTTTNLNVFKAAQAIKLPYYDDRMLKFICTIPENFLVDRRLQLAHLKTDKVLSNITWHQNKPFNINTYKYNKMPYNLPYRIKSKLIREFNSLLGKTLIQRNYELQFLGKNNDQYLKSYLFDEHFVKFIPEKLIKDFYLKFNNKNNVKFSHPVSMLLTLSLWHKKYFNQ